MSDTRMFLLELHRQGFQLTPDGDGIRIKPASALSPELVEKIRAQKAELLAALRDQSARLLRETEQAIAEMFQDPTWHRAWQLRFDRARSDGTLQNVANGVNACLDVARGNCEVGDLDATRSACAFALQCAAGKLWERGMESSAVEFEEVP